MDSHCTFINVLTVMNARRVHGANADVAEMKSERILSVETDAGVK